MEKVLNTNDYIIRKIDGKYVFLKFSNGDSHLLDETGTQFLDSYLDHMNYDFALKALCDLYTNTPKDTIERDFKEFIELLTKKEILVFPRA